jgi:hypothetical protein
MKTKLTSALLLVVAAKCCFAETSIKLSPLHNMGATGIFSMTITKSEQDGSGKIFEFTINLIDGEPISSLSGSYICSQGIQVCGVSYVGKNKFEPTLILLDQNLAEIGDLCDLKYVFSYPAYAFLMRFDWSAPDEGLTYYTAEKVPPNFSGIESWKVDSTSCARGTE